MSELRGKYLTSVLQTYIDMHSNYTSNEIEPWRMKRFKAAIGSTGTLSTMDAWNINLDAILAEVQYGLPDNDKPA